MPVNPCQNGTYAIPNGPFNFLVIGFTASEVGSIVSNFHGRETTEVISCRYIEPVSPSTGPEKAAQDYDRIREVLRITDISEVFQYFAAGPAFLLDFFMNFRKIIFLLEDKARQQRIADEAIRNNQFAIEQACAAESSRLRDWQGSWP